MDKMSQTVLMTKETEQTLYTLVSSDLHNLLTPQRYIKLHKQFQQY